ncbi:MAG: hypothetical protein WBO55_10240 [Rhizobiaceae bacterium]
MGRVLIIGIDPSSRKMAYIASPLTGPAVWKHVLLLPPKKETVTCMMAYRYTYRLISDYQKKGYDVRVFVERAVGAGGGGFGSLIPQVEAVGAVMAACGMLNVPVTKVQNSKWKKEVCGKGNATKGEIKAWCGEYWRLAYDLAAGDQDVLDAACINRWGVANTPKGLAMRAVPRKIAAKKNPNRRPPKRVFKKTAKKTAKKGMR